jgi:hypothetical protein
MRTIKETSQPVVGCPIPRIRPIHKEDLDRRESRPSSGGLQGYGKWEDDDSKAQEDLTVTMDRRPGSEERKMSALPCIAHTVKCY